MEPVGKTHEGSNALKPEQLHSFLSKQNHQTTPQSIKHRNINKKLPQILNKSSYHLLKAWLLLLLPLLQHISNCYYYYTLQLLMPVWLVHTLPTYSGSSPVNSSRTKNWFHTQLLLRRGSSPRLPAGGRSTEFSVIAWQPDSSHTARTSTLSTLSMLQVQKKVISEETGSDRQEEERLRQQNPEVHRTVSCPAEEEDTKRTNYMNFTFLWIVSTQKQAGVKISNMTAFSSCCLKTNYCLNDRKVWGNNFPPRI